jgi:hypothetical protein
LVGIAFECDVGVVDEPVDHGGDDDAEDLAPSSEGLLPMAISLARS